MEWNRVFFCPRGISLATTSVHCLLVHPSKKNLSSLQPSFRYCRLSQNPALAASSAPTPKGCCGLSLDCISFSIPQGLFQWKARLDIALQDAASLAQKGGVITVLVLLTSSAQRVVGLYCHKGALLARICLTVHREPQVLPRRAAAQPADPNLCWATGW